MMDKNTQRKIRKILLGTVDNQLHVPETKPKS